MKLSPVLIISFLPLLTTSTPVADPDPDPATLEPRADKWCTLGATIDYDVRCWSGAGSGYEPVRWIRATDPGLPGDRFGVRCKTYGEVINEKRVWDKIPSWNC